MSITTVISQFPPAPDSGTDTPEEFNGKANAFVDHQSDVYVDEVNNWANEANNLAGKMNNAVESAEAYAQNASDSATEAQGHANDAKDYSDIAMGSANYKGEWDSAASYVVGESVSLNGIFYVSKQDSTNVNPVGNPDYWEPLDSISFATQAEVDEGLLENVAISPKTFNDAAKWEKIKGSTFYVTDYASPQLAISAAVAAGGGTVFFPDGDYLINTTLSVVDASDIYLKGNGYNTRLIYTQPTGYLIDFHSTTGTLIYGFGISDMTIGRNTDATDGALISAHSMARGDIQNLWTNSWYNGVRYIEKTGILLTDCQQVRITRSRITNMDTGVFLANSENSHDNEKGCVDTTLNNTMLTGNTVGVQAQYSRGIYLGDVANFAGGGTNGFVFNQSKYIFCNNVVSDSHTSHNWRFLGSSEISLSNCWGCTNSSDNAYVDGFDFQSCMDVNIVSCFAYNNNRHGISLDSSCGEVAISTSSLTNNSRKSSLGAGLNSAAARLVVTGIKASNIYGRVATQHYGIRILSNGNLYVKAAVSAHGNLTADEEG